jgi:hypothetical protein
MGRAGPLARCEFAMLGEPIFAMEARSERSG